MKCDKRVKVKGIIQAEMLAIYKRTMLYTYVTHRVKMDMLVV